MSKVCWVVTPLFFVFCLLFSSYIIYILRNVIFYITDSGIPAYPRIGTAQFRVLNAFRHTLDRVLSYILEARKMIFDLQHIFCRMRGV
jgi:hypothetical protein